jgi:hypothetical protein
LTGSDNYKEDFDKHIIGGRIEVEIEYSQGKYSYIPIFVSYFNSEFGFRVSDINAELSGDNNNALSGLQKAFLSIGSDKYQNTTSIFGSTAPFEKGFRVSSNPNSLSQVSHTSVGESQLSGEGIGLSGKESAGLQYQVFQNNHVKLNLSYKDYRRGFRVSNNRKAAEEYALSHLINSFLSDGEDNMSGSPEVIVDYTQDHL